MHNTYQDLIQRFNSTPSKVEKLVQSNNKLASDIEAQANRLGILVNTDDIYSLNEFFNKMQTEIPLIQEGLQKASSFEDKETGQAQIELNSLREERRNPKYY